MSQTDSSELHQHVTSLRKDLRIETKLAGHSLRFKTTWGLFSPRQIDAGTKLLVEKIQISPDAHCLDMGCGYGPIGIALAKQCPDGHVLMVDKDFVAIQYTEENIALNGLSNAKAALCNGFEKVEGKFDCITSNIPAKVGNELLTIWMYDAHALLKPGGKLYLVMVAGLKDLFKRLLKQQFGNYKKIKQSGAYVLMSAEKL